MHRGTSETGDSGRAGRTDGVEEWSVVQETAPHSIDLFHREGVHAEVVGIVHVILDRIDRTTARSSGGTAEVRSAFGVRVTDQIALRVAASAVAPTLKRVKETEIVTDLMGEGAALIEGRSVGAIASVGFPEHDHPVLRLTGGAIRGESRDVSQKSTRGVGVDVHVPLGVPAEIDVVGAAVVVVGRVVGVRHAVGRIAVGIGVREIELDPCFVAWFTITAENRVHVLVENVDPALHHFQTQITQGATVVTQNVHDHRNSIVGDRGKVGVADRGGPHRAVGGVETGQLATDSGIEIRKGRAATRG